MHNDHTLFHNDTSSLRPPPSYTPTPSPITRRASILPHHSSRAPVEHVYSLFDSRNAPWASLKLISNVGSPRFLPAYFEGQSIQGKLELDIRKPETILGISLTVSGTIMAANAPDPRVFWELTRVIWNTDMGDPRASTSHISPPPPSAPSSSKAKEKAHSKLVGSYSFPFSIQLPSTCLVTLRSKQPPVTLPLPPSFSEKGASQFINYEITVRIRRGPLRIDSKLGTHFGFAPRTRPPAPSLLRQLAYQDNRPLAGPDGDPDGWTVLPPILVRGKLFGVRMVEAICTFALALPVRADPILSPLTYSRGHPLPLMLTITCSDSQALDLVFAPQNISVHLIREVCYETGCPDSSRWKSGLESSPADRSLGVTASVPSNFNSRAYLPRAVPQSELAAASSSFASASASASGSGPAGAVVSASSGGAADSVENASLARSRQQQLPSSSLYSHPSATASVAASSMSSPPISSSSATASGSTTTLSTSALSLSLSALSAFSSLSFGSRSRSEKKSKIKEKEKQREKVPKVGPKLALHGARSPITSAVWWHRQAGGGSSNISTNVTAGNRERSDSVGSMAAAGRMRSRLFEGEILLPKDLVPSFEFGGFSVKYALALLPFQAPGFELAPAPSPSALPSSPPLSPTSPASLTSSSPYSAGPSSLSPPSTLSSPTSTPLLRLTHEPLLLSIISIATLPYSASSPTASTLGSSGSSGSTLSSSPPHHPPLPLHLPSPLPPSLPPGIALAASASTTATMSSTPRSRVPPEVDAHAQRAAHADRVKKPVVWGLFNQFESGGPSTVSGSGSMD
ncbi:hypothetical protein ACEPAF_8195 [Sanghuangporus sanghuang]